MRNLPIHWSEGMFLRPHHFQAADRFWTEQQNLSEQWDHQFSYGVRLLEFSREALANHQFQIHALQARMKDGTLVALDSGQEPDRLDLKRPFNELEQAFVGLQDAFANTNVVRVFLAVPKLQLGQSNVGGRERDGRNRYVGVEQPLQDESSGGNDQQIQFRGLNVRLVLSTQDMSGYELLPLVQINRASEGEALPRVDPLYIPPLLAGDAWPGLNRDILRALYDVIGKKIEVLSQQVMNRGVSLDSQEPGDFDRILMLTQLNQCYATLSILAFSAGVHPFVSYTELCRIVGMLSIFAPDRRSQEVPRYDHDDLGPIFIRVKKIIESLIDSVKDYEYEQRFFVGVGNGMQVTLEPKWLNSDWQWFVGVHKGELNEQECRDLLSPGHLDWKLGSARQVEQLFKFRAEGVQLSPLNRSPRALPRSKDWVYYEVTRGNAAWKDVFETQTLAMRLKDSLIVNKTDLQGQRKMIVSSAGRQAVLQFALFAVPNRQ